MSNPKPQEGLAVSIRHAGLSLDGELVIPADAQSAVIMVPGAGASRRTPRNVFVASELNSAGFATLLFDLLTPAEAAEDLQTARYRFSIELLANRAGAAVDFITQLPQTAGMPVGLYGVGTGAAAAFAAAAARPGRIAAIVSRAGRTELAWSYLRRVTSPTLFLVGQNDARVLLLNQMALKAVEGETRLEVVVGAGHLFEEAGALSVVADFTVRWFKKHLAVQVPVDSVADR